MLLAALAAPAIATATTCRDYAGDFTAVAPAACSGVICTHGTLTGGFPSTYDFVADVVNPDNSFTGTSVITTTNGGLIFGEDAGQLTPTGPTTASFVTNVHIVGGTKQYGNASGTFVATGELSFITGETVGTYTARICKGRGQADDRSETLARAALRGGGG